MGLEFAKFPVLFPVSREFDPETGSPETASTANQSLASDILYPASLKRPQMAGFPRRRRTETAESAPGVASYYPNISVGHFDGSLSSRPSADRPAMVFGRNSRSARAIANRLLICNRRRHF